MARTTIGPVRFNIPQEKVERYLQYVFVDRMPLKWTARAVGISPTTGRAIYWAERDRRWLELMNKGVA